MQAHGTHEELAQLCELVHKHYDEYTSELMDMYAHLLRHRPDAIDPGYGYYEHRIMVAFCAYCLLQYNLEKTKEIHVDHHRGLITTTISKKQLRASLQRGGPDTAVQAQCRAGLSAMITEARRRDWYSDIDGWYQRSHLIPVLLPHAKLDARVEHAVKKERWDEKWAKRGFPHNHPLRPF